MAYTEKLLPVEALFSAWQNRRQNELRDDSAAKEREQIQNELLKEQLAAAKWQNMSAKERPTITLPAGPGLGGMREKQFLDQQAGYISGVSPADTFAQWQQNFRQGMTAGGGGGGGGRGGMVGGGQSAPGSYKTYDQLNNDAALQYNQAVADQAESQAQATNMAQQGYGSAAKEKLAQQMVDAQVGKIDNRAYDDLISGARGASRDRWKDVGMGDKMIANTKSIGNEMRGEIDATGRREITPGKQAAARAQVLNNAAKSLSSDPRFKGLDEEIKNKILTNIGTIVEDNIKTNGTPILEVGDVIAKYSK